MARRPNLPMLLAIAAALFLRALVPSGWMAVAAAGPFAIQPCPSADGAMAAVAMAHHHHKSHGQQHDGDCAFAPFPAAFASPDVPPTLAHPPFETTARAAAPADAPFATGPPAPTPPATGPPAIA